MCKYIKLRIDCVDHFKSDFLKSTRVKFKFKFKFKQQFI